MKYKKVFLISYLVSVGLYFISAICISAFLYYNRKQDIVYESININSPIFIEDTSSPVFSGVSAKSAVLIDGKSGAVLFEKNSDTRLYMASTTKIMTALIVLENLPLDAIVTVPKEATLVEGSSIYLRENEKITVETLLYGLLLESGNDAAHTLAVAVSGTTEKFAELMNEKARQMGLKNTCFANPHGLTDENHYTTAYELGFIASKALENPVFKEMTSTKNKMIQSLDGEVTRYFSNHNKMLNMYSGAIGVKTGFTKAAGRCLVSAAERNGNMFVAVTLNDGNDWRDHSAMLDYGFENYKSITVAKENEFGVYFGSERYTNPQSIYLTAEKDSEVILKYEVYKEADKVYVVYYANGQNLGKFHLVKEQL